MLGDGTWISWGVLLLEGIVNLFRARPIPPLAGNEKHQDFSTTGIGNSCIPDALPNPDFQGLGDV